MTTEYGPCNDWPVIWPCEVSTEQVAVTGTAVAIATEIVWGLSGRQFGTCTVKIRPCRRACAGEPWTYGYNELLSGSSWLQPFLYRGNWYNVVCGGCYTSDCSCSSISEVILPATATEITEVKVDGVELLPGEYRLDDNRKLVRIDDEWPWCNDLSKDDTEIDTWSVTAKYGRQVPQGGAAAVGELACEVLKALGGEDCRLPRQVSQLARQGVTITFPDTTALFAKGRTGLYLTDMFIATWNPNGLRQQSRVYSIDRAGARRVDT